MPECRKCHRIGPTADYRRAKEGTYLCKDRWTCEQTVKACKPAKGEK